MTPNTALKAYLTSLPSKERVAKRRDIMALCHISAVVLQNWQSGRTPINIAWQDKISKIIGEDIFVDVANS